MNWRKPILVGLMRVFAGPIADERNNIRSLEWLTPEEILEFQNRRLAALLHHAWENTEYYREILSQCGVVRAGKVYLDRFERIPFLTKDTLRSEGTRLKAGFLPKGRKPYSNSSGGSTGQPVEFLQDTRYWDVTIATRIYHFEVLGKELGEPEMKIWGSETDLLEGTIGWSAKLKNFLYNRSFEQCFWLPEKRIASIIQNINKYKPKLFFCYRDGMDLVANYVNRYSLSPHSPAAIVCAGGTLYPHIVETIEKAFKSPVFNAYGSREMGQVACQCMEKLGLHVAMHSHKLETINDDGVPVIETDGELVVTSLTNYAMPFIRYRIGDRGKLTTKVCPCGRGFGVLESVSGRVIERFINAQGDHIDPIYFIYQMRSVFNINLVKRFQFIQDDYTHITVRIVLELGVEREQISLDVKRYTEKLRLVMGRECSVSYEFVDDIPLTISGKHRYVLCNIPTDDDSPHKSAGRRDGMENNV